jgi:GTP-binding protein
VLNEIYDLFIDLDAEEDQLDFPVLYAISKPASPRPPWKIPPPISARSSTPSSSTFPIPPAIQDEVLQMLVANLDYSDYLGRLAIGRVFRRHAAISATRSRSASSMAPFTRPKSPSSTPSKDSSAWTRRSASRRHAGHRRRGGHHHRRNRHQRRNSRPLPRIQIDEPTIAMLFTINTSPFSGREGTLVTSRNLARPARQGAADQRLDSRRGAGGPDAFKVMGRGELQLAILIEMMRREGFELMVGKPEIITKTINGKVHEPVEHLVIDCPEAFLGVVIEKLGARKGKMSKMVNHGSGRVRLEFHIPSRGLIGLRSEILTDTRGTAIMNSLFHGYIEWQGEIESAPPVRWWPTAPARPPATRSSICRSAARSSSLRAPKFTRA